MLEIKNISVDTDDGGKRILSDVSLNIAKDSFTVITGPNGGGKSTLCKAIMGIVKPTMGKIVFNGEDITALDITERAKKGIGYAFQQPVRFKGLKVRDLLNIAAGKNLGVKEACGYLADVGLCAAGYTERELDAGLSGGELKRIEIAMLMLRNTPLSLFDEPEAGIDLWSFNNIIKVFENIRKKAKGAVVIISHQERILHIADEIVVIADGKIREQGKKADILPSLLCESGACKYFGKGVR